MYNKSIVIGRTKGIQKQELTENEKKNKINTKVKFIVRNTSLNSERQEVVNYPPFKDGGLLLNGSPN